VRIGRNDLEGFSDVSEIQGEVVNVNRDETMKSLTAIGISVEPTDEMRQSAYAGMPQYHHKRNDNSDCSFQVFNATGELIPMISNIRRTSL
jgi:hypothetical protein